MVDKGREFQTAKGLSALWDAGTVAGSQSFLRNEGSVITL